MTKILSLLLLGILLLASVASAQTSHAIMDTPGATSTDNWYYVLQTNELGLIFNWNYVLGTEPRRVGDCNRTLTAAEPEGRADTVLTGTSRIGSWTIKMNLDSARGITRVWGQDATGQFWVGSLVLRKVIPDEPRRNLRTPLRSIH